MRYITAQVNGLGNESAELIIESSLFLARNTAESWDRIWDTAVNPTEPIWQSISYLGGFIFFCYLIVYVIQGYGKSGFERESLIRVGVSGLFFFNNGYILATLGRFMHSISQYWASLILNYTLAGIKISSAIGSIQNTGVARARTSEIFAECIDKVGIALDECINDPVKIDRATELLQSLSGNAPLQGSLLEQIVNGLNSGLTALQNLPLLIAIQIISNVLQWCAMNIFQMASILAVMLSPVFVALSALPSGGESMSKWFVNYTKLLLFPISYAMICGFMANVLALTEQGGQPLGSTFLDVSYLVFIAVFAPILAWKGVNQMGTGVFETLASSAKSTVETGATAASGGADLLTKAKAIKEAQG